MLPKCKIYFTLLLLKKTLSKMAQKVLKGRNHSKDIINQMLFLLENKEKKSNKPFLNRS